MLRASVDNADATLHGRRFQPPETVIEPSFHTRRHVECHDMLPSDVTDPSVAPPRITAKSTAVTWARGVDGLSDVAEKGTGATHPLATDSMPFLQTKISTLGISEPSKTATPTSHVPESPGRVAAQVSGKPG